MIREDKINLLSYSVKRHNSIHHSEVDREDKRYTMNVGGDAKAHE